MYSNPSNFMTSRDKYVHSQQKHGRIDVSANLNNCASEYWPRPVYDDHDRLNLELKEKVDGLRSLSIKIGDELRSQNNLLGDMSGAFDRSEASNLIIAYLVVLANTSGVPKTPVVEYPITCESYKATIYLA
ncbi:hypothetical protein EWB00_007072 [Schistosoma japonicum]|uniref:t-SNARE coiled-coil homology domain-containing protein n=1 Tax=Schistosoma japonicum TaxID=6182 RepID=A0A4Z2DSV1_SCHJA|nr:hypothetical protein EWB00_007072 [Schistosoma japonicum]TNN19614.1 hypothetical protein EWB00_007072 [Schistosoma japonicum]